MKKYYRDEDLEATKLARAHAQAKVNDQEERFKAALDRGVLEQELESVFGEEEFAQKKGVDKGELHSAVEDLLQPPTTSLSQREIIKDAIQKQENPSLDEFISYVDERDLDTDKAILHLEKLVRSGRLSLPPSISLPEIEAKGHVAIDKPFKFDSKSHHEVPSVQEYKQSEPHRNGSSSSQRELLLKAVAENQPNVDAVIDSAAENGVSREKAALGLEKLIRSGEVVSLDLGEVEKAVEEILGTGVEQSSSIGDSEAPRNLTQKQNYTGDASSDSETSNVAKRSKREIMTDAIKENERPTSEEVIKYAKKYGISEQKAQRYLEKMIQTGNVLKTTEGVLRLV